MGLGIRTAGRGCLTWARGWNGAAGAGWLLQLLQDEDHRGLQRPPRLGRGTKATRARPVQSTAPPSSVSTLRVAESARPIVSCCVLEGVPREGREGKAKGSRTGERGHIFLRTYDLDA